MPKLFTVDKIIEEMHPGETIKLPVTFIDKLSKTRTPGFVELRRINQNNNMSKISNLTVNELLQAGIPPSIIIANISTQGIVDYAKIEEEFEASKMKGNDYDVDKKVTPEYLKPKVSEDVNSCSSDSGQSSEALENAKLVRKLVQLNNEINQLDVTSPNIDYLWYLYNRIEAIKGSNRLSFTDKESFSERLAFKVAHNFDEKFSQIIKNSEL